MKAEQYASMTDKELAGALAEKKAELFNLRFSHATGNLQNPLALRDCKRDIAKVKTVIRERELGLREAPKASEPKKSGKKTEEKKVAKKARG